MDHLDPIDEAGGICDRDQETAGPELDHRVHAQRRQSCFGRSSLQRVPSTQARGEASQVVRSGRVLELGGAQALAEVGRGRRQQSQDDRGEHGRILASGAEIR